MKLVEGQTLAETIACVSRREEALTSNGSSQTLKAKSESEPSCVGLYPPEAAAALVAIIARAVHYAHQRGVLHRDLKPGNILIDREGRPHVTDFGLAKIVEHDSSLTHSRAVMGSPNYMPPELAAGHAREATTAVDVYSLGAILYEMLAGCPPFATESPAQTLRLVLEEDPVLPTVHNPAMPLDLATVCLKCLEKDPARRYASAESLAEELDRFGRGEPITARPVGRAERSWRWSKRQPALAASLVALGIVFFFGFGGVIWKWRGEISQRQLAQRESRRAYEAVTRLEMERAETLLQAGDSSKGLAYLTRILRHEPTNRVAAERLMSALTYRAFSLPVAPLRHNRSLRSLSNAQKRSLAAKFAFFYEVIRCQRQL